ncbi:hypothetical protein U9M48_006586 [Paspalum notatum var. saurae]|uniref:Ninja-family protein n=1 Tax=Paspalum notatum var. saurae TaxID=547442 RepID=A0AAQ3SJL5_PASNO
MQWREHHSSLSQLIIHWSRRASTIDSARYTVHPAPAPRPRAQLQAPSRGCRAHRIPLGSRRGCAVAPELAPRVGRRIDTRRSRRRRSPVFAIPSGTACLKSETNQPKKDQKALPPLSPLPFCPLPRERRSQRPRRGAAAASPPQWRPSPSSVQPPCFSCDKASARAMDGYSRDLLSRFGQGDAPPPQEQGPARVEMEDVELTLGLSLGGRFGLDKKWEMLVRSSSLVAVLAPPVEAAPPPVLPRTSSMPVEAEASEGGIEAGAVRVEHAAGRPASGSPSSGSSDPEEHRLQGTLIRTSSLPAGINAAGTEELRKRKAAQSLKRLEVKKRIERRSSLTSNVSKEAVRQIAGEINANAGKYQATKAMAEEHSPSSSIQSSGKAASSSNEASPPLPARAVALRSRARRGRQNISGGAAAREGSAGDVQRMMMQEMPAVFTKDLANGNRMDGFLYNYRKGKDLRIVCLCHGSFLTPAEFIEHAGGGQVDNPLQHIVVVGFNCVVHRCFTPHGDPLSSLAHVLMLRHTDAEQVRNPGGLLELENVAILALLHTMVNPLSGTRQTRKRLSFLTVLNCLLAILRDPLET